MLSPPAPRLCLTATRCAWRRTNSTSTSWHGCALSPYRSVSNWCRASVPLPRVHLSVPRQWPTSVSQPMPLPNTPSRPRWPPRLICRPMPISTPNWLSSISVCISTCRLWSSSNSASRVLTSRKSSISPVLTMRR